VIAFLIPSKIFSVVFMISFRLIALKKAGGEPPAKGNAIR